MIQENYRRTKIVKSFEDKALSSEEAQAAAAQEIDVIRLVYEDRLQNQILEFIKASKAKRAAMPKPKAYRPQPFLLDIASFTQATITGLKAPREVVFGDKIRLSAKGPGDGLTIKTAVWDKLFVKQAKVYIGAGNVVLKVVNVSDGQVDLEVTQGGTIYPDMDVSVPETRHATDRRKITVESIRPLLAEGLDYLLIPGQWDVGKVVKFRREIQDEFGEKTPWMFLKIDAEETLSRLEGVINDVDGVLISRRELALSVSPAVVPMVTKEIIQLCNDRAKIVLTASEMLASMRRNVTPTRAEVSDVANAVIDGTDAVMISEEVANGKFGSKAVEVMSRIILDIETSAAIARPNWIKHTPTVANEMDAIAYHALTTAQRLKAKAIVTITKEGNTALKLASFRAPVPIIAVTFSDPVLRRLAIVRGVESMKVDIDPTLDDVLPFVNDHLLRGTWLKAGDRVVFVAITLSSVGREASNLLTVQTLA